MRLLFAGNKERGLLCLRRLLEDGHEIAVVLAHPGEGPAAPGSVAAEAERLGFPVFRPEDVNAPEALAPLKAIGPELSILAGYGQIVRQGFLSLAPRGTLNLHGGKLPECRGSSPMNWALINGADSFTLSVIRVDSGVDTGDVLRESTFPIGPEDTIADLQKTANKAFPEMLSAAVSEIVDGTSRPRKQDPAAAGYFPLRFPDDGMIFFDELTAEAVFNRIRALTDPYPGAFTYFGGRRIKLLAARREPVPFFGEPGRVYRAPAGGILVCASDRCLWITRAAFADSGEDALPSIKRYCKLATIRDCALAALVSGANHENP